MGEHLTKSGGGQGGSNVAGPRLVIWEGAPCMGHTWLESQCVLGLPIAEPPGREACLGGAVGSEPLRLLWVTDTLYTFGDQLGGQ